jgi:hypothetical protein
MRASLGYTSGLFYFVAGVAACFLGLTVASSVGHLLAVFLGFPQGWFDVDFIDPRAARLAITLQLLFVSLVFLAFGRWSRTLKEQSLWMLFASANPLAGMAGYLLYRLFLPFAPEVAYIGPANLVAMTLGFPAFFLMTVFGRCLQPR